MLKLSLYKKFAVIVLAVATGILFYVRYEWFPTVVASSHEKYEIEINAHIKMVGEGIIPFLIQSDYSNIYDTLDAIQQDNHLWLAIALYDPDGASIYPLDEIDFAAQPAGSRLFEQAVSVEGRPLGLIKVVYDFEVLQHDLNKLLTQFYIVLSVALSILLCLTLGGLYHFVFKPIRTLTLATQGVIQENYDIQVPNLGNNDVNVLAQNFVRMRNKIASDKESLSRINSELTNALATASEKSIMLDAIISSAGDAIVIFNQRGSMIIFNKVAEKIFRTSASTMLGKHIATLFPKETYETQLHGFQLEEESLLLGAIHTFEESLALRQSGQTFPISIAYSRYPIHGENTYTLIIKDISEAIAARNELKEAKEKAEQASTAKSDFLATMSHEIRTPMNGVIGMLTLLKKHHLSQEQERFVNIANSSAKSLLSIINDILDFSKIEAGKLTIDPFDFNILEDLDSLSISYALRAQEKNLLLICDVSGINHSRLYGDWLRIRQVLVNLIGNAIKFTDHGEIIVMAKTYQDALGNLRLECSVKDSGIGISEAALPQLFERFTQADSSTTRKYGGTGLGLAICQRLVELMGGHLNVTSQEGVGTCFTFDIPMLPVAQQPSPPSIPDTLLAQQVCIIDSNEAHAQAIARQLSNWGVSSEVVNARDQHHLDRLSQSNTVLLVGLQGEALSTFWPLWANSEVRSLPIILMTPLNHSPELPTAGATPTPISCEYPTSYHSLLNALQQLDDHLHGTANEDAEPLLAPQEQNPTPSLSATILLVEDNAINSEIAEGILEDFGCEVIAAEHGEQALAQLQAREDIDIVLMDCQMPVMDGYEATRLIREGLAGSHYRDVPIIALTAHAMSGDDDKCKTAGMTDYLTKPFDEDALFTKLAYYYARPKP